MNPSSASIKSSFRRLFWEKFSRTRRRFGFASRKASRSFLLGKGALITNSVGAATGTVATVTSVAGNSKKIANMDMRNEADTKSAANNVKMNLASNIIGGMTTAASATGAVLNASQIKEVKKLVEISQECEGVL